MSYAAPAVSQHATTMLPPPRTHCSCCGRPIDEATWDRMPFIGRMEDGAGGWLALHNCPCGTTLAKEVR